MPLTRITTSPALTFDALVAGEDGAPLVLLLHGFAESMPLLARAVHDPSEPFSA